MKLYIDTSVWSYLFADHLPSKKLVTENFFKQYKVIHEFYVSTLVLTELRKTKDLSLRQDLERSVEEYDPKLLENDDSATRLQKEILAAGIVSQSSEADALHLSFAIVNGVDAVVSWNMKDLVKLKTRRLVAAFCKVNSYKELDIVTPEEI